MPVTSFSVGDRITLKKKHPCGGVEWEVYRIGADIGMKCLTCERRMMLTRRAAERRTISRVEVVSNVGDDSESQSMCVTE